MIKPHPRRGYVNTKSWQKAPVHNTQRIPIYEKERNENKMRKDTNGQSLEVETQMTINI